jgi:putative DNA methylase
MTFGDLLRQRREQSNLSLRSVAERIGVDVSYLSRVEASKVPPSEQLISKLASELGWSQDELLMLAGRLPPSIRKMVEKEPYRVTSSLRSLAELAVSEPGAAYGHALLANHGPRAIEDGFPFEILSEIAEIESWRKEIYRPVYHTHKWWAQRLGSVFRAAILAATAPKGSSIIDLFYEPVKLPGMVIFDPFMGSGTTIGEAHKLGCTAIGRDINPVAFRAVRTALGQVERHEVVKLFGELQSTVGQEIARLYRGFDGDGCPCDILYFFWVKIVTCPSCSEPVDLFSTFQFARHAYVKQNPTVHIICPDCGAVFTGTYNQDSVSCPQCALRFDPTRGSVRRSTATCRHCETSFKIIDAARAQEGPPEHRMYAKLVLRDDGNKEYLAITDADREAYENACEELLTSSPPLPEVAIDDGVNTRQILNYGYRYWCQLFNPRQLLALTKLAQAITELPEGAARDILATLFSGTLEFNNMFASYKGEGTGAVRHMFSHHILKPERMPIEANVWGTPKSYGSFSTLFKSRILRALEYREAPFEVAVKHDGKRKSGKKVFGLNPPMGSRIVDRWPEQGLPLGSIYLSCGDSAATDLPDGCVDVVVTDPPFFDNVHYSELADFFHAWHDLYFGENGSDTRVLSTRSPNEVQDPDPQAFADKLMAVLAECHRVLRDSGLLVFSYHHSREEGWSSVSQAVHGAGFSFVASQPIKSEMSVATPKSQAKEPIDLDVLLVCRKSIDDQRPHLEAETAARTAISAALDQVQRFNRSGRMLSRGDIRVIVLSQILVELSAGRNGNELNQELENLLPRAREAVEKLWATQTESDSGKHGHHAQVIQLDLFQDGINVTRS